MATNTIDNGSLVGQANIEVESLKLEPWAKRMSGPEFLRQFKDDSGSKKAHELVGLYQRLFSESPWKEKELLDKPFEEARQIILSRFERQLSNPESVIVLLIHPHTRELMGLATAQLEIRTRAISKVVENIKDYANSPIPFSYLEDDFISNDNLTSASGDKVFIVEEFGIAFKFRGASNLITLANVLSWALRELDPKITDFFMWTHAKGNMQRLASSVGMHKLIEVTGKRDEDEVRLVGYKFKVGKLDEITRSEADFFRFLLFTACIKATKGNPELLTQFVTRMTSKFFKHRTNES